MTDVPNKCPDACQIHFCDWNIVDKNLIHALELLEKLQVDHYDDGYLFDYRLLNALKDTSAGEFSKSLEEIQELDKVPLGGVIFSFVE